MPQFQFARPAECVHAKARRIDAGKHLADRAVLARGIEGLEHRQDRATLFREEPVLEFVQPVDEILELFPEHGLRGRFFRRIAGEVADRETAIERHEMALREIHIVDAHDLSLSTRMKSHSPAPMSANTEPLASVIGQPARSTSNPTTGARKPAALPPVLTTP